MLIQVHFIVKDHWHNANIFELTVLHPVIGPIKPTLTQLLEDHDSWRSMKAQPAV
jgi:hypothetical protein